MCNRRRAPCLSESPSDELDPPQPHNILQLPHQAGLLMDSPCTALISVPGSASILSSNEDAQRVKFLCSFSGSILPRPQDGKLRYVGGDTRIVSVPRDITYEELMIRLKELYEGAEVLKYQQPDEDLDALVSVVNDDDVMNMMEEYDKLGSGDGFTRLRIFLFSLPEQDGSMQYIDGDDRNSERRYVDALNHMNDASDFRQQHLLDPLMIGTVEDMHLTEQIFSPMSNDLGVPHFNLHHLNIPRIGTGQLQVEPPWSPAYYSPRQYTPHELHAEFSSSPSSARYGMPVGGNFSGEYPWQQLGAEDQQQQLLENVVWIPNNGAPSGDMSIHGNMSHGPSVFDGNTCEHCRMSFERTQPHMEMNAQCSESPLGRDSYFLMNPNLKPVHVAHPWEPKDPRVLYSNPHSHEPGWTLSHPHVEDGGFHAAGNGTVRLNDYYARDGPSMNYSVGYPNAVGGYHVSSSYVEPDHGGEVFHEVAGSPHVPVGYTYGLDSNVHMLPQGHHLHPQTMWRNVPNAMHNGRSYEVPRTSQPVNGTTGSGFARVTTDDNPRFCVGVDSQVPRSELSQKASGFPGPSLALVTNRSGHLPELQHSYAQPTPPGVPHVEVDSNITTDVALKEQNAEGGDTNKMEVPGDQPAESEEKQKSRKPSVANGLRENGSDGKVITDLSAKEASLVSEEGPKPENKNENADPTDLAKISKEAEAKGVEATNTEGEEAGSDDYVHKPIEPTKAEAEAIAQGLQTIRNDDLEEIRELGSGTYGSVYHGKWRGSDVAIKRIKASCFAGRPSERERLIADFWKEAHRLSSMHHPNVVSFYGIVRDGPDGSLATVTEFMVNGSLKQFLQKKDRTIDRRKRLIIAMDAAFGMEYLHEKNVVHFDLKCENLLVNMRDPQRPVCKIGDLGLSKMKQHTLVSGGVRGTLPWMAPELLSGKSHMVSEKIDVYSFGIVMWELLTGEEPYPDMHCSSIIGGIVNNSLRPKIPTWCDPEWKALMTSCWAAEPSERPSFSEVSNKLRSMAAAMNLK